MSLLDLVVEKRPEILRLAAKHGARNLRLIGSVARGQEHSKSDVDFLADVDSEAKWVLGVDLQRLLGVPVDVASESNPDKAFLERVAADAIPLEADDFEKQAVIQCQRPHMPPDRDDRRLAYMLEHARAAMLFVAGVTKETFLTVRVLQNAILMELMLIGEAAGRVTEEFQGEHPEIPWRRIYNLRNRIVHDYERLDLEQVWDETIQQAVPELIESLKGLV